MIRGLRLTRTCELLDCSMSVSLYGRLDLLCDLNDLNDLNGTRVYFIALDHLFVLLLLFDCEMVCVHDLTSARAMPDYYCEI